MHGIEVIPIYVVTTPKSPRIEVTQQHFDELGLEVVWFEGINNHTFGLSSRVPWDGEYDNTEFSPTDVGAGLIKTGHIGCNLSHYMLWKTLTFLDHDEIIIFEDDVLVYDNFWENLEEVKEVLPKNWNFVYLGYDDENTPIEIKLKYRVNDRLIQIPSFHRTHAYMIKKEILPILLDRMHLSWLNLDMQLVRRVLPYVNYYICEPVLTTQKSVLCNTYPFDRITEE